LTSTELKKKKERHDSLMAELEILKSEIAEGDAIHSDPQKSMAADFADMQAQMAELQRQLAWPANVTSGIRGESAPGTPKEWPMPPSRRRCIINTHGDMDPFTADLSAILNHLFASASPNGAH
jgi:hypothetical protein